MALTHCASLGRLSFVIPSVLLSLTSSVAAKGTPKHLSDYNETAYDYIIVGGGLSGLVVANRLSEDSSSMLLTIHDCYRVFL